MMPCPRGIAPLVDLTAAGRSTFAIALNRPRHHRATHPTERAPQQCTTISHRAPPPAGKPTRTACSASPIRAARRSPGSRRGSGATASATPCAARVAGSRIIHAADPRTLQESPTRFGIPILFPFPGHVRGSRYTWAGVEHQLPPNSPDGRGYVHGFAQFHPWRVARDGPDSLFAEFSTLTDLPDRVAAGYPFAVRLRLALRLAQGALTVRLAATNEGDEAAPVGLGLHPYFALDALGGDRTAVRAEIPGRAEHLLDGSIPTGERRVVADGPVALPPPGQSLLRARTDLGNGVTATLVGPPGTSRIILTLTAGCRDLVLFAPPQQASISLEPHSVAPGAASQPPGHRDGLVGLAPQATIQLVATIAVDSRLD